MLEVLGDLANFVLTQLSNIWTVYTTSSVLAGFFVLFILDRLFHIFDILKRSGPRFWIYSNFTWRYLNYDCFDFYVG